MCSEHGQHHGMPHGHHGGACCGEEGLGHGPQHGMRHGSHHGGACCCDETGAGFGPGPRFGRRFPTREERIAWLEEYLKGLQAEAQAVEEHLAEMKAAG
jgi:hypothetical protein